jgi:hypothetical protein
MSCNHVGTSHELQSRRHLSNSHTPSTFLQLLLKKKKKKTQRHLSKERDERRATQRTAGGIVGLLSRYWRIPAGIQYEAQSDAKMGGAATSQAHEQEDCGRKICPPVSMFTTF